MIAAVLSALHLFALAIGLPAIVLRGRALKRRLDADGLARLFAADNAWGVAALLWIATGLLRAFGGFEKGAAFYLASPLFWVKMALLAIIIALEIWPMTTLIRWRIERRRGRIPDTSRARLFWTISHIQLVLGILMVFVASFMARGFGLR